MLVTNANIIADPTPGAESFIVPTRFSTMPAIDGDNPSSDTDEYQATGTRPYGQLAKWTIENIGVIAPRITSVHRLHCGRLSNNEKFKLWAHEWRLDALGAHVATCRMVLIQGSANEIINTWVFPAVPSHDPVFAAELIAMAGAPRLTFVDIQTPAIQHECHPIRNQTLALRNRFAEILSEEPPPEWAIADSQGGYVFSRQLAFDAFLTVQDCYKHYFAAYLDTIFGETASRTKRPEIACRRSLDRLRAYQIHHMESSPGNVFLSKLFGVDWTNDFLEKFLFTLA